MRIALFSEVFLPKVDGIVNTLCRVLESAAKRGHEVVLYAPASGLKQYAGARIVNLKNLHFPLYPELRLSFPRTQWRLSRELAQFRPNIVHTLTPAFLGISAMRWAKQSAHIPAVASYHTDLPHYMNDYRLSSLQPAAWKLLRWVYSLADQTLCPSQATMKQLQAHNFCNLTVWSRGVDTVTFHPNKFDASMRSRMSRGEPEKPLLLFVGRLAVEKRIDWIKPILAQHPNARLALVGDGPDRKRLEKVFADTRTEFLGYLHGEELAAAYASADIFAFPSASETFGNVLLEAMASGLPLVAAKAGGPLDFVTHENNGLLFSAENRHDFQTQVARLLHHPTLAQRLRTNGRAHAEQRSWDEVTGHLFDSYRRLIEAPRTAPLRPLSELPQLR